MYQNKSLSKRISKFFSRNHDDTTGQAECDIEMSVRSEQSDPSTSSVPANVQIIDVLECFKSAELSNHDINIEGVSFFKLKINDASSKPNQTKLDEFAQKYPNNSIVLLLVTKNGQNFYFYWKSSKIEYFLELKLYDDCEYLNDEELFNFLVDFIFKSLQDGNLGLHPKVPLEREYLETKLHYLADHRNYNLVMMAVEQKKFSVVKSLLNASLDTYNEETNAQTLAYRSKDFEMLMILLKENLTYPEFINVEECPEYIKDFVQISLNLHEAILSKDETKVLEILEVNPDIRHFYNLKNQSAPALALKKKLWDVYILMKSKGLQLGPHENFKRIKEKLSKKELEELRDRPYKETTFLPDNQINVLVSNSRIARGTTEHEKKYEIIKKAFETLNSNPFVKIILMIVTATRNFRIVFDFSKDTVEQIDPIADDYARGNFYLFGRINIAAKALLDPRTECEVFGTLAHELCHCAMNLVYENKANPYKLLDSTAEQEFRDILGICQENCEKDDIINVVYTKYPVELHPAELIVRIPHFYMHYAGNSDKLTELRGYFNDLFDHYEKKVKPEMEKALPIIEAKAEIQEQKNRLRIRNLTLISIFVGLIAIIFIVASIVGPLIVRTKIYNFSELSIDDKNLVYEAPVRYKNVELKLGNLFAVNSSVYYNLTSEHITQIFHNKILDFNDPHLHYLDEQVKHKWENMSKLLKDKILNSNFTFQNESLMFKELFKISSNAFEFLNSNEIIDILDGKNIILHEMIKSETKFYFERKIWEEYVREIYIGFLKQNSKEDIYICSKDTDSLQTNQTFKEFYDNFMSQNSSVRFEKISEFRKSSEYNSCDYIGIKIPKNNTQNKPDTSFSYDSLKLGFNQIVQLASNSKMFILSGEAGTGKTVTFEQFTIKIKKKFPARWVSYVDLKDHKHLYKNIQTLQDVKIMLETIFKINSKNKFQKILFKDFFESGNLVLLWNGFDEISPEYSEDVIRILRLIKNGTKKIQFICTRPLYADQLSINFEVKIYSLIPLSKIEQENFIKRCLKAENIEQSEIPKYVEKVRKIVYSTLSKEPFDTPLMLKMITELVSNDVKIYESENLFQIYEKFVRTKIKIWDEKSEFAKDFLIDYFTIYRRFSMMKVYQAYALKSDYQKRFILNADVFKLKIMRQKIPDKLTSDEISRMGILYINGPYNINFAHRTFEEFFLAQYIIDNIYDDDDNPFDDEAELRISVFEDIVENTGSFLYSFLFPAYFNDSNPFSQQISKALTTKHQKLIFSSNFFSSPKKTFYLVLHFLKRDKKVLKKQLQIDEKETFYTNIFKSYYYEYDPRTIKYIVRQYLNDEDEFKRFLQGRDQKGVIMYSMYLTRLLRLNLTHDFYQLDEQLLLNNDLYFVFETIAKNLTKNEFKELMLLENVFRAVRTADKKLQLIFGEKMWNYIESRLTKSDQIEILSKSYLIDNPWEVMTFTLKKLGEILTKDAIFNFLKTNFHKIHYYEENFQIHWAFVEKNTNRDQQKEILNKKNNCENEICKPFSLLFKSLNNFDLILTTYEKVYGQAELQEYILSYSSFEFASILKVNSFTWVGNVIDNLNKIFKNNKNALKEFLMRDIKEMNMKMFEFMGYRSKPQKLHDMLSIILSSDEFKNFTEGYQVNYIDPKISQIMKNFAVKELKFQVEKYSDDLN